MFILFSKFYNVCLLKHIALKKTFKSYNKYNILVGLFFYKDVFQIIENISFDWIDLHILTRKNDI